MTQQLNAFQKLGLVRPSPGALPTPTAPDAITDTTGIGLIPDSSASGIASPLTETNRTVWGTQAVSSDGLFVWDMPKKITMTDAIGRVVEFIYKEPGT